jgi:hypothetical protein
MERQACAGSTRTPFRTTTLRGLSMKPSGSPPATARRLTAAVVPDDENRRERQPERRDHR